MNISEAWLARFLGWMALVFMMVGCASTGEVKEALDASVDGGAPAVEEVPVVVNSLSVVGEGDKIMISATGPVRYTVFRLSEPERLIVDLPGVSLDELATPLKVNNNYITEITASTYGEGDNRIGRIVIGLRGGVDHDVRSGENSILVELKRNIFISGFSADGAKEARNEDRTMARAEEDRPAETEANEPVVEHLMGDIGVVELKPEPPSLNAAVEEKAAEPVEGAKSIVEISSFDESGATVVKVRADGALTNYNSFELADPARLVVDLPGVESSIGRYRLSVDSPYIDAVRVGRHPDKTRLVFDSKNDTIPPHILERDGDALLLRFGVDVEEGAAPVAGNDDESGMGRLDVVSSLPEVGGYEAKADTMYAATVPLPVERETIDKGEPVEELVQTAAAETGSYGPAEQETTEPTTEETGGHLVVVSPLPDTEVAVQPDLEYGEEVVPLLGAEPRSQGGGAGRAGRGTGGGSGVCKGRYKAL